MHQEKRRSVYAPPEDRSPLWGRIGAVVLMGGVFWADALTPTGVAVPVLYVAPVLLFMMGGWWWEPLIVALGATALIVVGLWVTPPGGNPEAGAINQLVLAVVVWIAALVVPPHRRDLGRRTWQYDRDRRAREQSIQRLEEMRYALDQAAIVAATDQRGI